LSLSPVFTSFQEPDLASRARALVAVPAGAFLLTQIYFSLYPLLTTVPRWLFETVRLVLLLGTVGGIAGGDWLAVRYRRQWSSRGGLWLAVTFGCSLLCGYLLLDMSVPFL
jgi:hypothetical protein